MTADRISVIVPTFNSAGTLRRCLLSLINQEVKPYEIIIVDGNSSDGTRQIARNFADVTLVTNEKSHYGGASRNLGAEQAAGNKVLFIDSDCYADKKLISWHAAGYQRNARLNGVQGAIRSVHKTKFARTIQSLFLTSYWIGNVKPNGMTRLNSTAGTNLSLDRDLFLRNRFSEDLPSCEDIELFIKLRRTKDVAILLEPRAVVYHPHPTSLQELFAQRKWYGEGSVKFYQKYWHSTFKRNSILNTSRRYVKWDTEVLGSALFSNHKLLCRNCPFGECRIRTSDLPRKTLPDAKYVRQLTCLGWAAGIYKVRTGIDYEWVRTRRQPDLKRNIVVQTKLGTS